MSELKQFRLPDVGEGLTEADIVKWHVQPGDKVTVNQIIVEIETAKAVVELPSPYEGVVAGLLVAEGTTADVGTPIISVDVGPDAGRSPHPPAPRGSTSADLIPPAAAEAGVEPGIEGTLAPKEERQAVLVGYGVKLGSTTRRPRKAPASARVPESAPDSPASFAPAAASTASGPAASSTSSAAATGGFGSGAAGPGADQGTAVLAKPPVRKLAKDLGVDLARLSGTGPGGSITRDDVQAAASGLVTAGMAETGAAGTGPEETGTAETGAAETGARSQPSTRPTAPNEPSAPNERE